MESAVEGLLVLTVIRIDSGTRRSFRYDLRMELIFEVREAEEGGYVARALGQAIFTEAETWQELRDNVLEATSLHFDDAPVKPKAHPIAFCKG